MVQKMVRKNGSKNSPKNSSKNSSRAQWSSRYFTPCPRTAPDQWNESEASHTFHFLDKFYFDYASLNLSCFVDSFRLRTTANPTAIRKDVLHYQETKFLLSIFPSHLCWEKSRYTRSYIRRDKGNDFVMTERTKFFSPHFRPEDLRKSFNGRIYIREVGVPSKFDWSGPSPKKRKGSNWTAIAAREEKNCSPEIALSL